MMIGSLRLTINMILEVCHKIIQKNWLTKLSLFQTWVLDGAHKKQKFSLNVSPISFRIKLNLNMTAGFQENQCDWDAILSALHEEEFLHRKLSHVKAFYEQVSSIFHDQIIIFWNNSITKSICFSFSSIHTETPSTTIHSLLILPGLTTLLLMKLNGFWI